MRSISLIQNKSISQAKRLHRQTPPPPQPDPPPRATVPVPESSSMMRRSSWSPAALHAAVPSGPRTLSDTPPGIPPHRRARNQPVGHITECADGDGPNGSTHRGVFGYPHSAACALSPFDPRNRGPGPSPPSSTFHTPFTFSQACCAWVGEGVRGAGHALGEGADVGRLIVRRHDHGQGRRHPVNGELEEPCGGGGDAEGRVVW